MRYDTAAGSLTAQIQFFRALADPQQTSALHNATASIGLGDAYGSDPLPTCQRGRDGMYVSVSLGDNAPPAVSFQEFAAHISGVQTSKAFSPDRTELDVTVQSSKFRNLNLICWYADAVNPASTDQFGSLTGYRLLDGFTPRDGDVSYVARENLELQAGWVNNNLGRPLNPVLFFDGRGFRCWQDAFGLSHCRVSRRMPSIVGKPFLNIVGSQYFTTRTDKLGQEYLSWHHDEHASLRWARCPAAIHPPTRLIGRRCVIRVHWTGTRALYRLL